MTDDPKKGIARREAEFLLYAAPDGAVKVQVLFKDETAWLTQRSMAELFGVGVPAINKHLNNIFGSGELRREATVSKMEMVRSEGGRDVTREVEVHNLDAIIAVGYRVNSYQATQFRIWATRTLREFIVKGFVLDDERLKQVVEGRFPRLESHRSPRDHAPLPGAWSSHEGLRGRVGLREPRPLRGAPALPPPRVEEVLHARCYPARAVDLDREEGAEPRRLFYGRTCAGRHLAVVVAPRPGDVMRPITCWPLSDTSVQRYEAWRKTVKR